MENSSELASQNKHSFVIEIPQDLSPLLSSPASWPDCCIYRVPKRLRSTNPAAYTPQLVSIGPFHHGDQSLLPMEKHKLRYLAEFCGRSKKSWTQLQMQIKIHEERILRCYDETFETLLTPDNFVKMVLLDCVFIIEFFLRMYECYVRGSRSLEADIIIGKPCLQYSLAQDLILLENQLPYFVLDDLYKFAFPNSDTDNYPSFHVLTCLNFIKFIYPPLITKKQHCSEKNEFQGKHKDYQALFICKFQGEEHKHFADLVWKFRSYNHPKLVHTKEFVRNLHSATKLQKAGVKFKVSQGSWPLDVKFESGKLTMPQFTFEDDTECVVRNLMALEQCHYPNQTHICNYIGLMDSLIKTRKDVDLLVQSGIIVHGLGRNEVVAKLVNNLATEIISSQFCYNNIVKDLNNYCQNCWYRHLYFTNLRRGS